jgi:hypothetical protein
MPGTSTKRFLSIRLDETELKEVYRLMDHSTCNSLTEYAKKVLLKKPVRVKVRDESKDLLLQEMIRIKNRLDLLADKPFLPDAVLNEITEIKSLIRNIAQK